MTNDQKRQIVEGALQYIRDKNIKQADFARYTGVGESYLSNILNGKFTYKAGGDKIVDIKDKYFEMIADKIDMSLVVAYWRVIQTPQFIQTISALEDAQKRAVVKLIIGQTGCGKTFTVDKFKEAYPTSFFKITVSQLHNIKDILEDLGAQLELKLPVRKASRLRMIAEKLRDMAMNGQKPCVCIDEAENLTHGMIGLSKAIYDAIIKYSGFVMIGTQELLDKLDTLERYGKEGIPQFRRRTKAGTVILSAINRQDDFAAFLADVQDADLRKFLTALCANYGELHDYLEPALRSAAEDGVVLTDQYFKTMYNINTNVA